MEKIMKVVQKYKDKDVGAENRFHSGRESTDNS